MVEMRARGLVVWISFVAVLALMMLAGVRTTPLVRPALAETASSKPGSHAAKATTRPNIVLIMTDDMRWDELENMPKTMAFLAAKGVRFTRAYVPNSLCCPSRTTTLTGQYSHDTGVWSNDNPYGGFNAFAYGYTRPDGIVVPPHEGHTIALDLQRAGYHTGLIGKYLNQYKLKTAKTLAPRPGWDSWITFITPPNYFNYTLDRNGKQRRYGTGAANYSTDVLAKDAVNFIKTAPAAKPLFLEFTPFAPHEPFTPAPRYASALPNCTGSAQPPGCYQPYTSPNVAEADVSDKPAWVQALAPGSGSTWNVLRKKQEQTLLSVDDAVGSIRAALNSTKRMSNTMVVFMSDNSLSGGSHRWLSKQTPWEEAIHIPLLIRYDPITGPRGGTVDGADMPLNIDLAPTFSALAGVAPPTGVWAYDGRSLLPEIAGTGTLNRTYFPLEHLEQGDAPIPSYCGVRTDDYAGAPLSGQWMYVRYATGEEELYDLGTDPWELTSLDKDPAYAAQKQALLDLTQQICSPPPPGYAW